MSRAPAPTTPRRPAAFLDPLNGYGLPMLIRSKLIRSNVRRSPLGCVTTQPLENVRPGKEGCSSEAVTVDSRAKCTSERRGP